jgi:hypothetical protein
MSLKRILSVRAVAMEYGESPEENQRRIMKELKFRQRILRESGLVPKKHLEQASRNVSEPEQKIYIG